MKALTLAQVARYRQVNSARRAFDPSVQQRDVRLFDKPVAKRVNQLPVGCICPRNQDRARSSSIQTMHDPGTQGPSNPR